MDSLTALEPPVDRKRRNAYRKTATSPAAAPTSAQPAGGADNGPRRRVLTEAEIAQAIGNLRSGSAFPTRDVALLYVLLTTGMKPLEIARLTVRDFLAGNGVVRQRSEIRKSVAIGGASRPLFFMSPAANAAILDYFEERRQRGHGLGTPKRFLGLAPGSAMFLDERGVSFEIVAHGKPGGKRFLCRGIHFTFRRIFQLSGVDAMSVGSARRTLAQRLLMRNASLRQIGSVLGVKELRGVRRWLATRPQDIEGLFAGIVS